MKDLSGGLSRRDFFRGAAASAIIATSRLPAQAEVSAAANAPYRRGRLSVVYQHVKAGATKPFSVLHISDTHLTAAYQSEGEKFCRFMDRRTKTFGGMQEESLAVSIDYAKQNTDYLVHTGDLIDFPGEANFDLVRKYFGSANGLIGAIGNHDYFHGKDEQRRIDTFRQARESFPFDLTFSSTVVNGVNFVTLDNSFGLISEAQATRFEVEVKKGLPIILCAHLPMFSLPNIWAAATKSGKAFRDPAEWVEPQSHDSLTREFKRRLKSEPLLKAMLAGHYHFTVQDRISPTAVQYAVGGNFMFIGQEIMIT